MYLPDPTFQVGYDVGDWITYFELNESRTDYVTDVQYKSNIGVPGAWLYQLNDIPTGKS